MIVLSNRSKNALWHILTGDQFKPRPKDWAPNVEDVTRLRIEDVMRQPNAGRKTMEEIKGWLVQFGTSFRNDPDYFCKCCGQKLPGPVNNPKK